MKTFLRYATISLLVLGCAGYFGSKIAGAYIRKNREARDAAYSSVVALAAKREKEDWMKQKAALEAEAAKHPGAIAPLPLIGNGALMAAREVDGRFDPAYFRSARWQEVADGIAICSFLLALFSSTARELIRRREAKI